MCAGAVCSWITDSQMLIYLPLGAELVPGDRLVLIPSALKAQGQQLTTNCCRWHGTHSQITGAANDDPGAVGGTTVLQAANPIRPVAVILFAGAGVCSNAVFDASSSKGATLTCRINLP